MVGKRLHTNGATGHVFNKIAGSTYAAKQTHLHEIQACVMSGFRGEADEKCVLGYYAASSGNPFPTFQDNLSVPSSRVKNPPPKNSTFSTRFIKERV